MVQLLSFQAWVYITTIIVRYSWKREGSPSLRGWRRPRMAASQERLVEALTSAFSPGDREELARNVSAIVDEARSHGLVDAELDKQIDSWVAQLPFRRNSWVGLDMALRDLRRLLLGPQSWFARAWGWMRRRAGQAFDHYVAVASLVAVIGGVFYGLAYARFYESLDITPEQAGLAPAQILSRSIVGGLALTLLVGLAIFCIFIALIPVQDDKASDKAQGRWRDVAANTTLTAAGLLVVTGVAALAGISAWATFRFFGIIALTFLVFGSLRLRLRGRRPVLVPAQLDISPDRYLVAFIAAAVPLGLMITGLATFNEATLLGERASVGKAVRDPKIVGFPFLGVRAEPALVSWRSGKRLASVPPCVLYLGTSNGSMILYDHQSSSTFHVPSGEIAIELRSEMSTCEAPVNVRLPAIERRVTGGLTCDRGDWKPERNVEFEFQWVLEGHALEDAPHPPWRLDDRRFRDDRVLYCEVTAETPLGSDTAVSRPFISGNGYLLNGR